MLKRDTLSTARCRVVMSHASPAKTSRHFAKLETGHSPRQGNRLAFWPRCCYWHVASPRVSELRGPRTLLVSLTLSSGDISISRRRRTLPFARTRRLKSPFKTSSFDIDLHRIDKARKETRNPWYSETDCKITLRRDSTESELGGNAN